MPGVYGRNGSESDPLRVDQLGISQEDYFQKRNNRRLLFMGITLILVLLMGILAAVVIDDTKPLPYNDDYGGGVGWNIPSSWSSNSSPKLDDLNERTSQNTGANKLKPGCESTLVIIRHCEKEGPAVEDEEGDQHCSYIGHERAHFLPTLFGPHHWPVPKLLYALAPGRGNWINYRELETLTPLAMKYGLPIHSEFSNNEGLVEDYFTKLATGEMCGAMALVSWKHSMIGELAEFLGCPDCPPNFPETSYDEVWQIKFVYNVIETEVYDENAATDIFDSTSDSSSSKVTIITDGTEGGGRRQLRQVKRKKKVAKHDPAIKRLWSVFSTRTSENYDPLKFSNMVGDYNKNGTAAGGQWMHLEEEVNEEM
jgi:hypothetical protein